MNTSNSYIDTSNSYIDTTSSYIDTSNSINETYIQIIMNQTNYSFKEAENKLTEHNNDYIKVIKEYLNIEEKKPINKSLNQEIYSEIRNFLSP